MQKKNIYLDTDRFYRSLTLSIENEQHINIIMEESDILLTCTSHYSKKDILSFIEKELFRLRQEIKAYILKDPLFQTSLSPLLDSTEKFSSPLVKDMLKASNLVSIGPFASVAGAIAEHLAHSVHSFLEEKGLASDVIVENGGDVFLISQKTRNIALLDKPNKDINSLPLALSLSPTIGTALCASSSTIGHSLSFGRGDLVAIIASNAAIADALATASCNMLKSPDDFTRILELIKRHEKNGVKGIFASCDEQFLVYGDIKLASL